ncbi:hypothetical protein Ndes2526B_g01053 [Nannochloris sp. 'desiccata']|nr:hypothetical protein KSW81_002128 [Chlorella desiccata (nom. nud.)]KAH7623807.1 hypothetical protein NADE_008625 [Chlorella desiccata (nom. nud.)]
MASEAALITKFFGRFTSAASRTISATASRSVAAVEIKASKAAAAPVVAAAAMNAAAPTPSAAVIMAKTASQTSTMSFRPSAFVNSSAFI